MPASDLTARIGSWIADVIGAGTALSGEEIGYAVSVATWPSAAGDIITWTLVMTMRSPMPGKPDLAVSATVHVAAPSEEGVRHFAATSLGQLRDQSAARKRAGLSAGNGGAKLPPDAARRLTGQYGRPGPPG